MCFGVEVGERPLATLDESLAMQTSSLEFETVKLLLVPLDLCCEYIERLSSAEHSNVRVEREDCLLSLRQSSLRISTATPATKPFDLDSTANEDGFES
jgi:hypothetical protein